LDIRVGIGYDIHRLVEGRRLVLGGVEIPSRVGLEGHSDADVALHALMDALLGAASLGDIGIHFPPGDQRYRNVSSLGLLETVGLFLEREGFEISNVDIVVIAEQPRIAPYTEAMCEGIARALHMSSARIGLKATTNEGVGAEGRREAISAQAVALIHRPNG
jgi:2-C-methyl-D-erythritol 2,4-cyclodiphosphate synthase